MRKSLRCRLGAGPLPRALTVMAAACWLAGLAVPFLKGVAKLLLVPITREFNLPLFLSYLVREDQGMTAVLLAVPMVLAPALLLLWLAALLAPRRRLLALPPPPLLAGWLLALVNGVALLGIRAGAAERATARFRPGAWLLLGGLVLAAAAATLVPAGHAANRHRET